MSKRLKNCIKGRIPKIDAVRDLLSKMNLEELRVRGLHEEIIDTLRRNRVFHEGTIGGYVAVGIDGVELFSSTKKSCPDCLSRKNRVGETEHFRRSVVCMTLGKAPYIILEQADSRILWEMMNRRWDIEENGFHQLKTYYHAKHCYCHMAAEDIFTLMVIGFNTRELYLYRRNRSFGISKMSRKSVSRIFCDELLIENMKEILYKKGG